jgi:hypothetical protein
VFGAGRRTRKRRRALAFGAVRLLLALAILCGTTQAGARYFYCEAFGLSTSDPCGGAAHGRNACPLRSIEPQSIDCCSVISIPLMPDGARLDERTVPSAGVVAILPAREYAVTPPLFDGDGFGQRAERWERPPRPGGELRAQLMVFLT